MKKTIAWVAVLGGMVTGAFGADVAEMTFAPSERCLLAYGWDTIFSTPDDVLANADLFDQTPFDGVGVMLRNVPLAAGGKISGDSIFTDAEWTMADVSRYVDVFRAYGRHRSLRKSFLALFCQPRPRIRFTDDAAWTRAAKILSVAARLAKKGGLRGLILDTEDYSPHAHQFVWRPEDGPSYEEALALSRRRGRELLGAVFREFPDATVMFLFLIGGTPDNFHYAGAADPVGTMRGNRDLWPAFVNGILDATPPTARLVDGNEGSYRNRHPSSGAHDYATIRLRGRDLVCPENRTKFDTLVQAAGSVYLDMYVNPSSCYWYRGARGKGVRQDTLNETVAMELGAVDEYVWFYGEKHAFVPWIGPGVGRKNVPTFTNATWNAVLPGCYSDLALLKDPYGETRRRLKTFGEAADRVRPFKMPEACAKGESYGEALGLETGAFYAVLGEMHGEAEMLAAVPMDGKEPNWNGYGWSYPVISDPGADGWRTVELALRIGPDCDGVRLYVKPAEWRSEPVRFRNFRAVRVSRRRETK